MYSIKEISKITGIQAHTLRIWEQRYDLFHPVRSKTNIRQYTDNDLKKILNISILRRNGHKISHIAKLRDDEIYELASIVTSSQLSNNGEFINRIIEFTIQFDREEIIRLLDKFTENNSVEYLITSTLPLLLTEIGDKWMTNHLKVAHEHFISNLIKEYLLSEISKLPAAVSPIKCVGFLHENESHEFALICANYLFLKRGIQFVYLGANLPDDNLEFIQNHIKPDFVITSFISHVPPPWINRYVDKLELIFNDSNILIGGSNTHQLTSQSHRIHILSDFDHLHRFINTISTSKK